MLIEKAQTVFFTDEGAQTIGAPWSLVDRIGLEQDLAKGRATVSYPLEEASPGIGLPGFTHLVRTKEGAPVEVVMREGERELPNLYSEGLSFLVKIGQTVEGLQQTLQRYVYVEEQPFVPLPLEFWRLPVYLDRSRGALVTLNEGRPCTILEDNFDGLTYAS